MSATEAHELFLEKQATLIPGLVGICMSIVAVCQSFRAIIAMQLLYLVTMIGLFQPKEFYVTFSVFQFLICLVLFDWFNQGLVRCLTVTRSRSSWSILWDEATMEYIIVIPRERSGRQRGIPRWLNDYILTGTSVGHRDNLTSKEDYCYHVYFAVIDTILGEMKRWFSESNKEIMNAIQSCSPNSDKFVVLKPLIDLYSLNLLSQANLKLEVVHVAKVLHR